MKRAKTNSLTDLLRFAFFGSAAASLTFALVFPVALPSTDGAYMRWGGILADPIALALMIAGTGIGGLIAFLWALMLLRHADLWLSARLTYSVVLGTIVVVGPLFGFINLPLAFVSLCLAMFYCRLRYPLAENDPSVITE